MDENFSPEPNSMLDRIKESPRTVSAIIIILIVAAAIYAFSGNKEQPQAETSPTPVASEVVALTSTAPEASQAVNSTTAPTATTVTQEELAKKAESLPQATKTDQGYVEVAVKGDGLTHLARRAATRWLSENQAGFTVTNEHRVYIEDYIRRQLAKQPVSVGQSETVPFNVIADGVAKAGKLTDKQLRNLTKYTFALK